MNRSALLKTRLESAFGSPVFSVPPRPELQTIPIGIAELDGPYGGLPRGALTEIIGDASSGRTTLLHSILAQATGRGEVCALVDLSDAFDPESAAAAGLQLQQLLWIRCGSHKRNALAVTDLLLQNGGWGVIALDLGDIDPKDARRIPLSAWHRFRLAVENKPTAFLVVGQQAYAGSCSAWTLETGAARPQWEGLLLRGAVFQAQCRKPPGRAGACFAVAAFGACRK
jgi:recombination protein RecA